MKVASFFCALQPKFYPRKEDVAWKAVITWSVGQKPTVEETSLVLVIRYPDKSKYVIRGRNQNKLENDPEYEQVIEPPGSEMDAN